MTKRIEGPKGALILLASMTAIAGCVSSPPPPPDQMARTTLQTAPADLQLLCADATAKSVNLDRSKLLPTSSRQLDAASYSVEISETNRKFNCVIGTDGKVASITPA